MHKCLTSALALGTLVLLPGVTGGAEDPQIAGLLAEITTASTEIGGLRAEMKENLRLREINLEKARELEPETGRLAEQRRAAEAVEREVAPIIASSCTGTFTESEFAAAQARCDSALARFNPLSAAYNEALRLHQEKLKPLLEEEGDLARKAREIATDYDTAATKIRGLQGRVKQILQRRCTPACARLSCAGDDCANVAQCMQNCWDGAAGAGGLALLTSPVPPLYDPMPIRSRQQAIEEYRQSGATRPGANTLRTAPVPPPSVPGTDPK